MQWGHGGLMIVFFITMLRGDPVRGGGVMLEGGWMTHWE